MNSGIILVFLVAFLAIPTRLQYSKEFAGPYDILIKEVAMCGNEEVKQVYDSTKLSRINRTTYVYSTNITFTQPLDDETQLYLVVAVFGNGGWRNNYHQMSVDKLCTYLKTTIAKASSSFFKSMGVGHCPVPAGNYTVRNFVVNIEVGIPVLPYNRYRVDGTLKNNGTPYGCFRLFLDIVPKKKKPGH